MDAPDAVPAATPLSCLIVGCGYVGTRLARRESGRRPLLAIVRSGPSETEVTRAAQVPAMRLDLDASEHLLQRTLADAARDAAVVYLVPPPAQGMTDPRLEAFLKDLGDAAPAVFVYVSTTGVYGDTAGAPVDETSPLKPASDRARRRVAAESAVTAWCSSRGVRCVVLRVPGIYGPHRLPLERLERREPALQPADAGPGNRIHVDDLVAAIVAAIDTPTALGAYNVSDGDHSSTTAYLQATADAAGLPAPALVPKSEARRMAPGLRTPLDESRRVSNRRMIEDLGVTLRYPGMHMGILASLAEMRMEDTKT
jgi:nucleoside-diphosphate-sugar epimerase